MASKQLGSFTISAVSSAAGELSSPLPNVLPGRKFKRLRLRIACPLSNSGSTYNLTSTDSVNLAKNLFGNFNLTFGQVAPDAVDVGLNFATARAQYMFQEGSDFTINGFALGAVTGSNVPITGSTGSTVQLEYVRSFLRVRGARQLTRHCPGYTQMSQAQISLQPTGTSPTFNSGAVAINGSTLTVQAIGEDMPSVRRANEWAQVPRAKQITLANETIPLPIGNKGALVDAVWDQAQAEASSPYTLTDIKIDGVLIQGPIAYAQLYQGIEDDLPKGWTDPSTLVTPLYTSNVISDESDMESGNVAVFDQPNNDQTSPQLTVLFIPATDESTQEQIRANVSQGDTATVKNGILASTHALRGESPSAHVAATGSTAILPASSSHAKTLNGIDIATGQVQVSPLSQNEIKAHVANAGGAQNPGGSAAINNAAAALAVSIPGYSSASKVIGVTNAHATLSSKIASFVTPTAVAATAAKTRARAAGARAAAAVK